MRSVPQTYQMSEKGYDVFTGFFRLGFVASATVGLTGLAGLTAGVIMTHTSPENSQLAREITDFCGMPTFIGTLGSLYFKTTCVLNPPRDALREAPKE